MYGVLLSVDRLAENLTSVKARIAKAASNSGRNIEDIRLVAVSKTREVDYVRALFEQGQTDFGENYLQEALAKIATLRDLKICWHFIGAVQSNKTRSVAESFDWVQTVDRQRIARRLNNQRPGHLEPLNICIQINLDNEVSKSGATVEAAFDLAEMVNELSNLVLRGVMYIPAPQSDFAAQLQSCKRAFNEFQLLRERFPTMDTLSLGMSSDLEAAVQEGSTMVRIGADIFGARQAGDIL